MATLSGSRSSRRSPANRRYVTWLAYYAGGFYPATTANLLLSAYLLAYVPARLAYAVERVPYLALLVVATLPVISALAVAFSGVTDLSLFVATAATWLWTGTADRPRRASRPTEPRTAPPSTARPPTTIYILGRNVAYGSPADRRRPL